jgi:hypothetical protein
MPPRAARRSNLQNCFLDSAQRALSSLLYLSLARPLSVLVPVPALGMVPIEGAVVAPVLLVLFGPLLGLLLIWLGVPDAPMLLREFLLFRVSLGAAPSFARLPGVAVLEVLVVREVDWHPAASAAASVMATRATGRMDGLSM